MKKKFLITSIIFVLLSTGCNKTTTNSGNPGDPGPTPVDSFTEYTVNFENFDLHGNKYFQSSDNTFNSTLLEYINRPLDGLASSFDSTGNNYVRIQKDTFASDYGTAEGLIIGSQENDGEITIGFSQELAYVKVKAQQYYNIQMYYDNANSLSYLSPNYDGQEYIEDDSELGFHYEGHFSFIVNDDIWIGPGEGYKYNEDWTLEINVPEIVEKKFDINSNSLTIEGFASERARIYELTFGFKD